MGTGSGVLEFLLEVTAAGDIGVSVAQVHTLPSTCMCFIAGVMLLTG